MAQQRMSEQDFRTKSRDKDAEKKSVKRGGVGLPLFGYTGAMPAQRSLYALLFCAAAIDRNLHPDEIAEVNALAVRTQTLGKASTKKLQKMHESFEKDLEDELKTLRLAEKATRFFRNKPRRRASAFMHTLDILFADRDLTEREKLFIRQLAYFMDIPAETASEYVDILMTKNEH